MACDLLSGAGPVLMSAGGGEASSGQWPTTQGQATTPAPRFCRWSPTRSSSSPESTPTAPCESGGKGGTGGNVRRAQDRDPLSAGRTDPPAQQPPRAVNARRPLPVESCGDRQPYPRSTTSSRWDDAGLILGFPAWVCSVTVASGLGDFTHPAWPHACLGVRSPWSPVWPRSPVGKWAASSWRNASASPSRATAANLSCSTTN